ncbi:MAG: hypothetical protein E7Z87_08330 [Cyanobacteria bacterium SIG26]|nr:hypothetical protein [Cyanobacteria bacterium SIG26]
MNKYTLKIKDSTYTIPKENLKILAMTKGIFAQTDEKFNELKKWLPIVTRLEKQFGCYEKAKGIAYKTYTEQFFRELENLKIKLKMYECQEKYPGQCRCAFRCLDNDFCNDAEKRINTHKTKLEKIKTLLEDALDPDKTNSDESFRNFYKAVELSEVLDV